MAAVEIKILNSGKLDSKMSASALELSLELQKLMMQMKSGFMSEDGRGVDYKALTTSEVFQKYVTKTRQLQDVKLATLEKEEKIAFFLNIYNALTIHGLATCEGRVPNSVLEITNFWKATAYRIGHHVFSLDDIEHGILRGNRPHPSSPEPLLLQGDERLEYSLSEEDVDPRIHFALVCGAKSCPAINVYSAKNLKYGLQAAAINFCEQEVEIGNKQVTLSKLFLWYRRDFGSTDIELLRNLSQYLEDEKQHKMDAVIKLIENGESVEIKYSEYNWNLNKSNL